jgi:NAD(P) transhydrogenase subunit alpha
MLRPLDDPEGMRRLAGTGVMAIALEMVPRITRAQKMDALSAMATVAGYRAVLLAAEALARFVPGRTCGSTALKPRIQEVGASDGSRRRRSASSRKGKSWCCTTDQMISSSRSE